MRTYLVTGGAGFIGSNYIHYMFKKYDNDIRIINVDALTYAGNLENLKDIEARDNYTFVKADICDKNAITKIFEENDIDRVVHFAAESHVDRSIKNPEVFVQTNVLGTAVMLNCAKAAWEQSDGTFKEGKKFLHVSTDEVYGSLPDDDSAFFYETTPYDPHSPYSASKASSDMLVKAYMDTYKFPANITNCSNNYGPYQFPEKLIPLIINNALSGKKLPVYGDGKNVRDWLYVMDHAKAIDMVQEKGKLFETYNIGGHNEKQNIEIINIIIDTLNEMLPDSDPRKAHINKELITYVEDRKGHDRRYAIAPDKIKKDLGWEPETMFRDGIKLTIAWFFENEEWMKNVTSGDYQKYYSDMYDNK
ncbi:MAG: dTDP-glucose 4,6-dehydratase [Lachnospiraceae bacterium]|nr:dTDP-glucose 4,6-dehydratase [Lachnospiraceae bacterium]